MCRLFGMTAGCDRVRATFWLLGAADSLRRQSHRNPDGTGLGYFDAYGAPIIEKQALPAYEDAAFALGARERVSTTFVAHVRKSSGTAVCERNTHPFAMEERIFAHNGVIGDLPRLEARLGAAREWVRGDTDSERMFALITTEIERTGSVAAGIGSAMTWIAAHLPVTSANFVLAEPGHLWVMRYPATHELWLLERQATGHELNHRSPLGTRVRSPHLADRPSVIVASEPLDDEVWQLLEPGVLLHVEPDLCITRTDLLTDIGSTAS